MNIEYDPIKRSKTLVERGLDFADAADVFQGVHFTALDVRQDYSEDRYITIGWLLEELVVLVWTLRGDVYRIISMRKANDREKKLFAQNI